MVLNGSDYESKIFNTHTHIGSSAKEGRPAEQGFPWLIANSLLTSGGGKREKKIAGRDGKKRRGREREGFSEADWKKRGIIFVKGK